MVGRTLTFLVAALLAATFNAASVQAQWMLDNEASRISFVSVKADDLGEAHYFKRISGEIDEDGKVALEIDMASVETLIDLRNERMINFLFEVDLYPVANIYSQLDMSDFSEMANGEQKTVLIDLVIMLHSVSQPSEADVVVTRLAPGKVLVTSLDPVILDAADFLFAGGLRKLQELASLDMISMAVPVTFQLVFVQE